LFGRNHKSLDNSLFQYYFFVILPQKVELGRVIAIDYGQKRVGLAVTDELRMIATALDTVQAKDVIDYLKEYIARENVDCIVVGYPLTLQNQLSESAKFTEPFVKHLKKIFPNIPVERIDERFTSKMASAAIFESGARKKDRRDKALVDKVSAVIILQSFLESKALQR
jgi:putative holliday junction resolvase